MNNTNTNKNTKVKEFINDYIQIINQKFGRLSDKASNTTEQVTQIVKDLIKDKLTEAEYTKGNIETNQMEDEDHDYLVFAPNEETRAENKKELDVAEAAIAKYKELQESIEKLSASEIHNIFMDLDKVYLEIWSYIPNKENARSVLMFKQDEDIKKYWFREFVREKLDERFKVTEKRTNTSKENEMLQSYLTMLKETSNKILRNPEFSFSNIAEVKKEIETVDEYLSNNKKKQDDVIFIDACKKIYIKLGLGVSKYVDKVFEDGNTSSERNLLIERVGIDLYTLYVFLSFLYQMFKDVNMSWIENMYLQFGPYLTKKTSNALKSQNALKTLSSNVDGYNEYELYEDGVFYKIVAYKPYSSVKRVEKGNKRAEAIVCKNSDLDFIFPKLTNIQDIEVESDVFVITYDNNVKMIDKDGQIIKNANMTNNANKKTAPITIRVPKSIVSSLFPTAQKGGKQNKSSPKMLMLKENKRVYQVHTNKQKQQYIKKGRQSVMLSSIKGKYNYVK